MRRKVSEPSLKKTKKDTLKKSESESKSYFKIWKDNRTNLRRYQSKSRKSQHEIKKKDKSEESCESNNPFLGIMLEHNQMGDVEKYLEVLEETLRKEIWFYRDPFQTFDTKPVKKMKKKSSRTRSLEAKSKDKILNKNSKQVKKRLRTFSTKLKKIRRNRSDKKLKKESRYLQILNKNNKREVPEKSEIFKNDVETEESSFNRVKHGSINELLNPNLVSENLITFDLRDKLSKLTKEGGEEIQWGKSLKPAQLLQIDSQVYDSEKNDYITLRGGNSLIQESGIPELSNYNKSSIRKIDIENLHYKLISKDGRCFALWLLELAENARSIPEENKIVVQNGSQIDFDSQKYFDIVKGTVQENNFNLVFSKPLSFNNSQVATPNGVSTPNKFRNPLGSFENEFAINSDFDGRSHFSLNSG